MNISEIQNQRFETLQAVLQYFYRDNTRSYLAQVREPQRVLMPLRDEAQKIIVK